MAVTFYEELFLMDTTVRLIGSFTCIKSILYKVFLER